MEDLITTTLLEEEKLHLPNLTQYGVRLPFRVAIVGQTDSGKTHFIMRRWLGGKISFWRLNDKGAATETDLQHCLFCSNGGMFPNEKTVLLHEFVKNDRQKLFHIGRFPQKQEMFDFISKEK